MSIYVIADLHLSFNENKPMNIFGDNWCNHEEKIKEDWNKKVNENDLIILPGDFSWAMHLKDTYKDFEYLNSLPGKKLLLKGNHDYWWTTLKKMREYLKENSFENIDFIYNSSYEYNNKIIVGTRGWQDGKTEEDKRLIKREIARLELSLQDGIKKYGDNKEFIVFMHYPPITNNISLNENEAKFIEIMKQYNVKECFYGHLHGQSIKEAFEGEYEGIYFKLISADALNFKLYKII